MHSVILPPDMSEEEAKKIYPYYTASKTPATGAWVGMTMSSR